MAKVLIIDASVAGAAGSAEPAKPSSKATRTFLTAVLDFGHLAGMTEELSDEWTEHAARFARSWRRQMLGRKRVVPLGATGNPHLRRRILGTATCQDDADTLDKDFHLIYGALQTNNIVASLDEEVRALLSEACDAVHELRHVMWVNPDHDDDLPDWLEEDAPVQSARYL